MSPNPRPSFLCLPKTLNPKFMPPNPGSYFLSLTKNPKPMAPNPRPSFLCFPKTLNPESMPSNPWCCSFRLPKNPKPMSPNPWPSFPSHESKSLQFSFTGVVVEFHDEFKHVRDSTCCCIYSFLCDCYMWSTLLWVFAASPTKCFDHIVELQSFREQESPDEGLQVSEKRKVTTLWSN